jgi:hypothetical protein
MHQAWGGAWTPHEGNRLPSFIKAELIWFTSTYLGLGSRGIGQI